MTVSAEDSLSAWCEAVIRFIAAQMLDPHRHFEQKLLGQLARAQSRTARLQLLSQLTGWLAQDRLLTAAQRDTLDTMLTARGWPGTRLAEQDPHRAARMLTDKAADRP